MLQQRERGRERRGRRGGSRRKGGDLLDQTCSLLVPPSCPERSLFIIIATSFSCSTDHHDHDHHRERGNSSIFPPALALSSAPAATLPLLPLLPFTDDDDDETRRGLITRFTRGRSRERQGKQLKVSAAFFLCHKSRYPYKYPLSHTHTTLWSHTHNTNTR